MLLDELKQLKETCWLNPKLQPVAAANEGCALV